MRNRILRIVTPVLAVAATVARVVLLPGAVGNGTTLTQVSYPLLLVLLAAGVVPWVLGRAKKSERFAPGAADHPAVAVAGMLMGLFMLGESLYEAYQLLIHGTAPAPNETLGGGLDTFAIAVSLTAGIVGGVFLIARFACVRGGAHTSPLVPGAPLGGVAAVITGTVGVLAGLLLAALLVWRRMAVKAASGTDLLGSVLGVAVGVALTAAFFFWLLHGRYRTGWLWLLPVLWLLARLARYDVCYIQSPDVSPAIYEFLTFAAAILFLFAAAQYFSGVGKPSRHMQGLAAAAAVLTLAATCSRLILWAMGETAAVNYCALPNAADAGVGLFALAMTGVLSTESAKNDKE